MAVETATKISALNAAWPLGTDLKSEGDNHLRLIKSALQAVFDDSGTTLKTTLPIDSPNAYVKAATNPALNFKDGADVVRAQIYDDTTNNKLVAVLNNAAGANVGNGELFYAGNCPINKATAGYMKLANGFMVQWNFYGGSGTDLVLTFPTAFPTTCAAVLIQPYGSPVTNAAYTITADQVSSTTFAWRPRYIGSGGSISPQAIAGYWFALGW